MKVRKKFIFGISCKISSHYNLIRDNKLDGGQKVWFLSVLEPIKTKDYALHWDSFALSQLKLY
jgi:hypothetical protein